MDLHEILLTKNDCYKKAQKCKPAGIVVHSTGANNPRIKRYVQPDMYDIGINANYNDWNRPGVNKCVHAFIGQDSKGNIKTIQTLPFDICCWGVGKGSKGSYNYKPAFIQFEICEDALTNKDYFEAVFKEATEFCAFLMEKYNIKIDRVISHNEAYKEGYGSGHADCDHWLKRFGKDMDWFRSEVVKYLTKPVEAPKKKEKVDITYTVVKGDNLSRIAKNNGTTVDKICNWNKDKYPSLENNPGLIFAGWVLKVGERNE